MLFEAWTGTLVGGMAKWDEAVAILKRHGEAIRKHRLVAHYWVLRPNDGEMNKVITVLAFKSMEDRQEWYRTVFTETPDVSATQKALNECPHLDSNRWEMHQYYEP